MSTLHATYTASHREFFFAFEPLVRHLYVISRFTACSSSHYHFLDRAHPQIIISG